MFTSATFRSPRLAPPTYVRSIPALAASFSCENPDRCRASRRFSPKRFRMSARDSAVTWLEMLSDRFGAFEAIAYASLQMARTGGHENAPPMSRMTADAILEFGDDLRLAYESAEHWAAERNAVAAADEALGRSAI